MRETKIAQIVRDKLSFNEFTLFSVSCNDIEIDSMHAALCRFLSNKCLAGFKKLLRLIYKLYEAVIDLLYDF